MKMLKIGLASFALLAFAGFAVGQSGQGLWPNFPVVGGSSYCASTQNGVCRSTIPAGPTVLTGSEGIPANTNLSQGRSPQNVIITPAGLNANPITFTAVTTTAPSIIASNLSGGVVFTSAATITSANITLPLGAIQGQQYRVSSNRTITTLSVSAPAGDTIAANTAPTVLTASTTSPNGYIFIYNKAATTWYRLM